MLWLCCKTLTFLSAKYFFLKSFVCLNPYRDLACAPSLAARVRLNQREKK